MNARLLLSIFDAIYLLSMTAWVGAILFFSFGVAPIIFKVLGAESAAKFVRALFPRYYAWGASCGAVALPASLCGPLSVPELRGPSVAATAFVILAGTLVMFYCGQSLTPAINAARDAGPEGKQRFDRLHRLSVRLNGLVLLAGIGLLVAFAFRPAPRSSGIVELDPAERAYGLDREFLKKQEDWVRESRSKESARRPASAAERDRLLDEELKNLADRYLIERNRILGEKAKLQETRTRELDELRDKVKQSERTLRALNEERDGLRKAIEKERGIAKEAAKTGRRRSPE